MRDKAKRGPKVPAHIIANPGLYEGEIWLIRKILAAKIMPQWKIAKMFKVDQSTISHINTSSGWLCREGIYA